MNLSTLISLGMLIITGLSLAIALRKDSRGDARADGEQMAMLNSIRSGVDDIRLEQRAMRDRADVQAKELAECLSSCKSAHHRIDEINQRMNQLQMHPPD